MAWYGRRRTREPRGGASAAVVGIAVAMFGVLALQTSSTLREAVSGSRRTMDAVSASLASHSPGVGLVLDFSDKKSKARIEALETEVRDLQKWKTLAETMSMRMRRYEEMLNLIGETTGAEVTARIVAEPRGPFSATRIVNAGAAEGVREGYFAINEFGLVGRVIRVGEHTSRILLVTDFNSRIPVMGRISGDRALLVGDSGEGAKLLEPETPDRIVEGEVWVTSGDGGQMAMGIPVGRARRDGQDWRIDLAIEAGPLDFVRLTPAPDFASPESEPIVPKDATGKPQTAGSATAGNGGEQ
ncbi:MAG: rod shape-determining protein MreC [Hyphomonadaceae bacterium]